MRVWTDGQWGAEKDGLISYVEMGSKSVAEVLSYYTAFVSCLRQNVHDTELYVDFVESQPQPGQCVYKSPLTKWMLYYTVDCIMTKYCSSKVKAQNSQLTSMMCHQSSR